jgi:hypothetical protein
VRGTTRSDERRAAIEATGAEVWVGDPPHRDDQLRARRRDDPLLAGWAWTRKDAALHGRG